MILFFDILSTKNILRNFLTLWIVFFSFRGLWPIGIQTESIYYLSPTGISRVNQVELLLILDEVKRTAF